MYIRVDTNRIIARTDPRRFLGFCIDADQFEGDAHESCMWEMDNPVVRTLCKELAPATVRLGGAGIERIEFVDDETATPTPRDSYNFVFGTKKADSFGEFCKEIGADIMLSIPIKNGDVDNARRFAEYFVHQRRDAVPFVEMGNEPDWCWSHGNDDFVERVRRFHEVLAPRFPGQAWIGGYGGRSYPFGVCNPDSAPYMRFIEECGDIVDLFSVHYYACSANRPYSTKEYLLDQYGADIAFTRLNELKRLMKQYGHDAKGITVNEFNTFASQGIDGISNSMMAAVWLADIVGNMAEAGSAVNNIQCGFGRTHGRYQFWRYAMIDTQGHAIRVNPHYYAFYLWSRMMGNEHLFCCRQRTHPVNCHATRREGAVTIMLTNKDLHAGHEVEVDLSPMSALVNRCELFTIQGDAPESRDAAINGVSVDEQGSMGSAPPEALPVHDGRIRVALAPCTVSLVVVDASGKT